MTCKDCLHFDACDKWTGIDLILSEYQTNCKDFKDKSRFIELPCNVGDTVYFVKSAFRILSEPKAEKIVKIEIYEHEIIYRTETRVFDILKINISVFLTREEAEQALKERE